jgi:hypothetical protein
MKLPGKFILSFILAAIAVGLFFFANSGLTLWQKIVSNILFGVYAAAFYLEYVTQDMRTLPIAPVTEWRRAPGGLYRVDGFAFKETPRDFPYRARRLWRAGAVVFLILTIANIILSIFVFEQEVMRVEMMVHSAIFVICAALVLILADA